MMYFIDAAALFTLSLLSYIAPCMQAKSVLEKKKIEYLSSTMHAILVSLMSGLVILGDDLPYSLYYCSLGYYIADIWYLIHINVYQNKSIFTDAPLIIHHLVMLLYEGYAIIYDPVDYQAFYFMNRVLLAEFAVIPLNAVWYFKTIDVNNNLGLAIASISLLITYFLSRVVNLTLLFIEVYYSPIRYVGLCGFPVLVFNYMWFYKIVKGFIKHFLGKELKLR